MYDHAQIGIDLAFKYRNPVMIQSDGAIGQMMEKVVISEQRPRRSFEEIVKTCPWATTGKTPDRERNIATSLELDSAKQEMVNHKIQSKE
jgi:2-oxoglutarate ferredoxin oxidoreductase subunit alpha